MAELITVHGTGDRVALWERDPAHPGGEAFVAGPALVQVAPTPAVLAGIRVGRLVEIKPKPAHQPVQVDAKPAQRKKA